MKDNSMSESRDRKRNKVSPLKRWHRANKDTRRIRDMIERCGEGIDWSRVKTR